MTPAELQRTAAALGIDAIGAAAVGPYTETERHIRERRAAGLFGRMRFTTARPEVSCHPELLLPGARTVVSGALCYWAAGTEPAAGEGELPRYAWRDHYAILRERLDELGRRLGGAYRVLVDDNDHVDREAAVRAGIAFYGKNTMAITREHGSWVVLGTLVTDIEFQSSPRLRPGCGSCTLCLEACPTGALDEPGALDATRCLSYWTQTAEQMPDDVMDALGPRVYGCDICQDVCPWNRGVEKRRASMPLPIDATPTVDLRDWLEPRGIPDEQLDRLFVPRNDQRWLQRNALVAAGNSGARDLLPAARRHATTVAGSSDPPDVAVASAARRAITRLERLVPGRDAAAE
ncbi:MAG: tRNA epoxyqueuosine(34) reductase QueG [Gaiellales bacterium]